MTEYPEKRRDARYVCEGGVEVREAAAGARGFWGTMSDISLGGCYIQTFSPMKKGAEVNFLIKIEAIEIRGSGTVVAMHPGVGMGIVFSHLAEPDRQRLDQLLRSLAARDKDKPQGGGTMQVIP